MFNGKKIIIFDMDGTLIDSIGIWNEVDKVLISRIRSDGKTETGNIQEQRDAVLRSAVKVENPYVEYCRYLKERYGSSLSAREVHTLRYEICQDYLQNRIAYKKDADTLIRKLKKEGYILAIASTTRRDNMNIYREKNENIRTKANIDDYFTLVYTSEDAREIKPSPEIYLRIQKELGVKAEECLVFEDSLIGIEAAKNAGMEAVAVYDQYSDSDRERINSLADYQIRSFTELLQQVSVQYRLRRVSAERQENLAIFRNSSIALLK